jgi:hypothetical protein
VSNVPPGWYPDPWQQAAQRFWDGNEWTHRVSGGGPHVDRPRLRDDAPIYGPLIWIIAVLPVVSGITVWFMHIDVSPIIDYLRQVQDAQQLGMPAPQPPTGVNPFGIYGVGYFVSVLVGLLAYAASIVLSYLDERRLARLGVVRPFGWGWSWLTSLVYVIGRSVIVRRVAAPRGLVPIWVTIAATVVALISSMVWLFVLVGQIAPQLDQLSQTMPS